MDFFYRYILSTGAALAAGGAVVALDLTGVAGTSWYWGALEFLCGTLAGLGLAKGWMRPEASRREKCGIGLLLLIHIWTLWLWIPFAAGLFCREKGEIPGIPWARKCLFLWSATGLFVAGMMLLYKSVFPQPLKADWFWAFPGAAAVLAGPWLAATCFPVCAPRGKKRLLGESAWWGSLLLGAVFLGRIPVWGADWCSGAAIGAAILVSGYGFFRMKEIPVPPVERKFRLVSPGMAGGFLLFSCGLDYFTFGTMGNLRNFYAENRAMVLPEVQAVRQYFAQHGSAPGSVEDLPPVKLPESILVTGTDLDKDGCFRIFFVEKNKNLTFCFFRTADGAEGWEIADQYHPLQKPGDRRWIYPFPY